MYSQTYNSDQLNSLMAETDYLVVAAALTPETRGLISGGSLAHSKPGQVLINIAIYYHIKKLHLNYYVLILIFSDLSF